MKQFIRPDAGAIVMELGCASADLLIRFAGGGANRTRLVCLEPSSRLLPLARQALAASGALSWVARQKAWDAADAQELGPIRLFLSSHVLEHMPDLCAFARELYAAMEPGGWVFTEVPTSEAGAVARAGWTPFRHFHLTLTTPSGFVALMASAGFVLADLQTLLSFGNKRGQGEEGRPGRGGPELLWLRTVFYKPRRPPPRPWTSPRHVTAAADGHEDAPHSGGSSRAAAWLEAARSGHCGATRLSDRPSPEKCRAGMRRRNGAWRLDAASWEAAVASCAEFCAACHGCRHISVSLHRSECGWYRDCPSLSSTADSFVSGPVDAWRSAATLTSGS